jgi:hypothetical protein
LAPVIIFVFLICFTVFAARSAIVRRLLNRCRLMLRLLPLLHWTLLRRTLLLG